MGMYDDISTPLARRIIKDCPHCKKDLYTWDEEANWQTKSFDCILKTISEDNLDSPVFEMHTICPNCGTYLSLGVDLSKNRYDVFVKGEKISTNVIDDTSLSKEYFEIREIAQKVEPFLSKCRTLNVPFLELVSLYNDSNSVTEFIEMLSKECYVIYKQDAAFDYDAE